MSETPKRPRGSALRDGLATVTLWGFAVAQPTYDLLSRGAELLVAHRLEPADVVVLAAVLSFFAPGLLVLLEFVERRFLRSSRLHLLWVALLAAALALQALGGLPAAAALAVSAALGALFAWALSRSDAARWFVAVLTPAAVIFPALFLLRPPVSGLLFPREVDMDSAAAIDSETPVVLVLLDELPTTSLMDPSRRIDARRYPAFADLASRSHWFRNATSVAEGTKYAVPAILTGRYPDRPRLAHLSEYPENLFTWLGSTYSMNVVESLTRMCPEDLRLTTGLEEGFAERMSSTLEDLGVVYLHRLLPERLTARLPPVTSTWRDFRDAGSEPAPAVDPGPEPQKRRGASAQVFSRFLDSIQPARRPVLHFLHLNLPHVPWKYLPSGKEYGPLDARQHPHGLHGGRWTGEWASIQAFQRHLLQLVYTDRLLGRLLARLRETDLFDRSLVILTADHGVSFQPGESRREVAEKTRADILAVPLLVKTPFQTEGTISERNVETVDILPTIADVLAEPLPWPVDGSSALDDTRPPRAQKVLVDAHGHEIVGRVVMEPRLAGDATLRRLHSIFGSAEEPEALFRIGRFRDLIGREPAALPPAPGSGLEVDLSDAWMLEDLDPSSGYVPARIFGSLGAVPGERARDLAVAVNGRIRAVTESWEAVDGERRFSAMVPEESFREGFNQVEVFEVLAGGEAPRLAAIPSKTAVRFDLQLAADGSAQRIVASDGRSFPVVEEAVQGEAVFDGVSFRGWAADVEEARVADSVLLFAGREQVTRVRTGEFRRDLAERYGKAALARAGFSFLVPYSAIGDPSAARLRFFAILGDVAAPIPYREAWPA